MHIAIALCAALLVGTGLVLQQQTAEQEPTKYFLHLKLIAQLIRKPRWLAGIAVMTGGYVLSGYTFDNLQLTVAEPLLATNLLSPARPSPVRLLGLAQAVAAGSEPEHGTDPLTRMLDAVTPA